MPAVFVSYDSNFPEKLKEKQMNETTFKPLSWFILSPQLRDDLGSETELRNLGENILKNGQIYPVTAEPDGELVTGFRRFHGAMLVGAPGLHVSIYPKKLTPLEKTAIRFSENIHRLDMNAFDKWQALEEIKAGNSQWSAKDLAEYLKLDPSAITKWLSPSKCIESWQQALKEQKVTISDCYVASQVPQQEQSYLLLLKLSGMNRDQLQRAARRQTKTPVKDEARTKRVTILLPGGTAITVAGNDLDMSAIVDDLTECLQSAKKALKDRLDAKTWEKVMKDQATANGDVVGV